MAGAMTSPWQQTSGCEFNSSRSIVLPVRAPHRMMNEVSSVGFMKISGPGAGIPRKNTRLQAAASVRSPSMINAAKSTNGHSVGSGRVGSNGRSRLGSMPALAERLDEPPFWRASGGGNRTEHN
jgi:hypothetical protein